MTDTTSLHDVLFDEAERARWRVTDIAWDGVRGDLATPMLRSTVRAALVQELPTYEATQHYMREYHDDPEFSQWVSIWFYEETKHPQVLRRWLSAVGEPVDDAVIVDGRTTYPLPRAFAGSMAVSIIAELSAAKLYLMLAQMSPEPVLADLCRCLAADESRHASGFFRFAVRAFETSDRPQRVARQMLTVLRTWLRSPGLIQHPVNSFSGAFSADDPHRVAVPLEARVCHVFGNALGMAIDGPDDVDRALRSVGRRAS